MDANLIPVEVVVVAVTALCLMFLSFGLRLMTYREPRVRRAPAPLRSALLRARPVSR